MQVGDVNYSVSERQFVAFGKMTPQQVEELYTSLDQGAIPILLDNENELSVSLALFKFPSYPIGKTIDFMYLSSSNELLIRSLDKQTGEWSVPTSPLKVTEYLIEISFVKLLTTQITDSATTIYIRCGEAFLKTAFNGLNQENQTEWWDTMKKTEGGFFEILAGCLIYCVGVGILKKGEIFGTLLSFDGESFYAQIGTQLEKILSVDKELEAIENSMLSLTLL